VLIRHVWAVREREVVFNQRWAHYISRPRGKARHQTFGSFLCQPVASSHAWPIRHNIGSLSACPAICVLSISPWDENTAGIVIVGVPERSAASADIADSKCEWPRCCTRWSPAGARLSARAGRV
jgi:hypothetical protein